MTDEKSDINPIIAISNDYASAAHRLMDCVKQSAYALNSPVGVKSHWIACVLEDSRKLRQEIEKIENSIKALRDETPDVKKENEI